MGKNFILNQIMVFIILLCLSGLVLFSFSGCSISKRQYSRDLIAAIEANDMEKLQVLVDKGGDLDMLPMGKILADGFSRPPLVVAVVNANFEAVKILVEGGASLDVRSIDAFDSTPLYMAISGCIDQDRDGKYDAKRRNIYYEIVYYLIDNGANIHLKYHNGNTVLHSLAFWYLGDEQGLDLFLYLLEKGARLDGGDAEHVIFFACQHDTGLKIVKHLFENYGIDVNMRSKKQQKTILMHTLSYNGSPEICQYLLEQGADKTLKNADGKTAYDLAVEYYQNAVEHKNDEAIESFKRIIALLED